MADTGNQSEEFLKISDDNEFPNKFVKHIGRFPDSDDENDNMIAHKELSINSEEASLNDITTKPKKSRLRISSFGVNDNDNSGSDNETNIGNSMKESSTRVKIRRQKLQEKFKNLSSQIKPGDILNCQRKNVIADDDEHNSEGSCSEASDSSIEKIRQKIKERSSRLKMTLCDPDTSDDEESSLKKMTVSKKKERKSIKLTSPKPKRMSAKQALENMHKIKSESNRMLREKEISLPYHRPKALTLKDVMSRRKAAMTPDGKVLPIKMNDTQLKHYVKMLEQRQKEMIELCKSDSEEESQDDHMLDSDSKVNLLENNDHQKDIINEESKDDVLDNIDGDKNNLDEPDAHSFNVNSENKDMVNESKLKNVNDKETENEVNTNANVNNFNLDVNDELFDVTMGNHNIVKKTLENHENESHSENAIGTEGDSQLINLHFGTETENNSVGVINVESEEKLLSEINDEKIKDNIEHTFSDSDTNIEDIDAIIQNASIIEDPINSSTSSMSITNNQSLLLKPKLTGIPGSVIDLDESNPIPSKRLSGVEVLKKRFTYFAKLKTPEEMEREREHRIKPGMLHIKLKQELEEKIAEQRSLEWAKRLEEEKQQQKEFDLIGESEEEDNIEKVEVNLEQTSGKVTDTESDDEEDEMEQNIVEKEKPRKHNPMIDDEAEESDCDNECDARELESIEADRENIENEKEDENVDDNEDSDEESCESESSEEETEGSIIPRKGRILKAFEDSDEEDAPNKINQVPVVDIPHILVNDEIPVNMEEIQNEHHELIQSQDVELQSAQINKSISEDLFPTSQESTLKTPITCNENVELGTQTFSILRSNTESKEETEYLKCSERFNALQDTQLSGNGKLNDFVGVCSMNFSQDLVNSQCASLQASNTQDLGDDVLALCTGKFYDNPFVSQVDENTDKCIPDQSQCDNYVLEDVNKKDDGSTEQQKNNDEQNIIEHDSRKEFIQNDIVETCNYNHNQCNEICNKENIDDNKRKTEDENILKSILEELTDSEFDSPKPNKFFVASNEKKIGVSSAQVKKKFIIESDDEEKGLPEQNSTNKKRKFKKKKPEKRALQISDDEDEELAVYDNEVSDLEDEGSERIVEYDSEENEVEVKPEDFKNKRKVADFLDQEAELTSEDEWMGSGDEDERGLDRMEREEGDEEIFHQDQLQSELGKIHMRDILDQDKREVRLLQELLFEDGDLGGGHRQRKFRWKNAGDEEDIGTELDNITDTQEEEFESEEQWRKQRHEREVFLRQMQQKDNEEETLNTLNRTTIIKANLCSKTMSSLLMEVNTSATEKNTDMSVKNENTVVLEKKTSKDIPSPKKPFSVFQMNYHGSLLSRGRGALARLAALATPLATDGDDAPKVGSLAPTSKRNFVFAAITPDDEPKVTIKRKAEVKVDTPRLIKKMKLDEKKKNTKSLLDHIEFL